MSESEVLIASGKRMNKVSDQEEIAWLQSALDKLKREETPFPFDYTIRSEIVTSPAKIDALRKPCEEVIVFEEPRGSEPPHMYHLGSLNTTPFGKTFESYQQQTSPTELANYFMQQGPAGCRVVFIKIIRE